MRLDDREPAVSIERSPFSRRLFLRQTLVAGVVAAAPGLLAACAPAAPAAKPTEAAKAAPAPAPAAPAAPAPAAPAASPAAKPAAAAPAAPSGQKVVIKYGHPFPPTGPQGGAAAEFKKIVESKTSYYDVQLFPQGQL